MDISNCTTENYCSEDQTSISPTISSQVDNENELIEKKNSENCLQRISLIDLDSHHLNPSINSKKNQEEENFENRNTLNLSSNENTQKLTPVKQHPLMFDDNDSEESSSFSNARNFQYPDVVLMTHNQQRLNHPTKSSTSSSTDLVNSMNNNDGRNRQPKYREPSPVSIHIHTKFIINLLRKCTHKRVP